MPACRRKQQSRNFSGNSIAGLPEELTRHVVQ